MQNNDDQSPARPRLEPGTFYNRAESATVPGAGLVVWLQAVQPLLVIHNYEIKLWN